MVGPVISGDAIDIFEDCLVCGNDAFKDTLQMYSISQRKRVSIWEFSSFKGDYESGFIYGTRFTNDGNFVIAGGAGKN
jgi:hypothetical protein